MKKTYLVVGLGRFGSAVAQRLYELGSEVMAVDLHPELVQKMESKVTCAAVCDARDEDALRALGARNYDCAVVAIGGDLATSVVATLNLKELGVQTVVCKATDETQRRALEKIGADRVVVPERRLPGRLCAAAPDRCAAGHGAGPGAGQRGRPRRRAGA